ncbi:acetylornithine deacetylase [Maritimibacter dapengensis]|uniref:Acetylornithine deacetylase n=1 Tax=Maritimibacter dapengensis TaxID=2836868 RepID=A0ABS6SYJ5_9RHOB|nr:acetylornithine deacetylase [Maritimibacter dapengensis]MBV7378027.1 acetylornithine deacetylase [Maritimibacter dapengensis]
MADFYSTRDILARLIAFPTVSADPNRDLIDWIADYLQGVGARVEVLPSAEGGKANLFATFGPEGDAGVVLSGHTDVVPVADQDWTSDPFELREADGLLFGRGTCDMKGFIACCLTLAPKLADAELTRPIHFAFTHDEEVGCLGAAELVKAITDRELRPAMAIIGEPTEMRIIEGHKGCCEYTTRFHGLEGHGSAPDLGVNAAEYAVRYVGRLMELREELKTRAPALSGFEPPWTTINIGGVHGGVAHNVIVGKAEVEWEFRPVQERDFEFVTSEMAMFAGDVLLPEMQAVHPEAAIETEVVGEVPGLEPMDENAARDLVAELTGANTAGLVAFGTEAGLFQGLGMNVVICGPGSIEQAHKPDEFVAADQLVACLEMLEGLVEKFSVKA